MKLAPSVLSADFARLADQVRRAEAAGGDYIHVDVMDGRFVPNITVGPLIVEAIRRSCSLPVDVHLMIQDPEHYVGDFIEAGASIVTVHQEACRHLQATLSIIRSLGAGAGVALCPATPVGLIEELADDLDLVLIMTVNPGFGGQALIPATVGKVRRAREWLDRVGCPAELEVDGGVNSSTAPRLVDAGADVLVAGSAIFSDDEIESNLRRLREVAQRPRSGVSNL